MPLWNGVGQCIILQNGFTYSKSLQRCQPSLFQMEAAYFQKHFTPFLKHPNLANSLFGKFCAIEVSWILRSWVLFSLNPPGFLDVNVSISVFCMLWNLTGSSKAFKWNKKLMALSCSPGAPPQYVLADWLIGMLFIWTNHMLAGKKSQHI